MMTYQETEREFLRACTDRQENSCDHGFEGRPVRLERCRACVIVEAAGQIRALKADLERALTNHSLDLSAAPEATTPAHTDHPARHFDRTCPACIATALDDASEKLALAAEYEAGTEELLRRIKESRHWAEEGQKWGYLLDEATHDLIQGPQSMNVSRSSEEK